MPRTAHAVTRVCDFDAAASTVTTTVQDHRAVAVLLLAIPPYLDIRYEEVDLASVPPDRGDGVASANCARRVNNLERTQPTVVIGSAWLPEQFGPK